MLGLSHEERIVEEMWQAAADRAKLPLPMARHFFEPKGPMPTHFDSRRSFHRYYLRSKAVLIQNDRIYGVYTTDVSRQGIGFLSPRQLLPKQRCTLKLPNGTEFHVQIKRCRRECEGCFACGGCFINPDDPKEPATAEVSHDTSR